jgi:hypothetical protein
MSEYDDVNLNESRQTLRKMYHIAITHVNNVSQKQQQQSNASDNSTKPVDPHVKELYLQNIYLMYLLATSSDRQPGDITIEDMRNELKSLFYNKVLDDCSLIYVFFMMTVSESEKCMGYVNIARQKKSKPEHIITEAEIYLRTKQSMAGFDALQYFERPEPVIAPALPMPTITNRMSISSPDAAVDVIEDVVPASALGKRSRPSIDASSRKAGRSTYGSTPSQAQPSPSPYVESSAQNQLIPIIATQTAPTIPPVTSLSQADVLPPMASLPQELTLFLCQQ